MILENIAFIGAPGNRTKAYLQNMCKFNLIPSYVILMDNGKLNNKISVANKIVEKNNFSFDETETILSTLITNNIKYKIVKTNNINDNKIYEILKTKKQNIWIYSGFPSGIIKSKMFKLNKKFLHVHPGYLPYYRGSTTVYYSVLKENNVGVSSMFLNEKIDQGPIIMREKFSLPNKQDFDYIYDPKIRSKILIETLKKLINDENYYTCIQKPEDGETYYIIHPILKHLSIMKLNK